MIGLTTWTAISSGIVSPLENSVSEKEQEIEALSEDLQELEKQKTDTESSLEKKLKEERRMRSEIDKLKQELQAKKEQERKLALVETVEAQETTVNISGDKETWMRSAGIPEGQWWAVDFIVSHESGWDPCAYNPGQTDCSAQPVTACGLAQSLPCSKLADAGIHWTDPVGNLKWQYNYVTNRYGGYPQAVEFWKANSWY